MSEAAVPSATEPAAASHSGDHAPHQQGHGHHQGSLAKLAVGAIGVVFGDIGTSPLYAMRDTFAGHHPLPLDPLHIYGIVSLMFWSMMVIVTLKYVTVIMRADNKGEGGSLALLALINKSISGKRWSAGIVLLGVFATALFYGDSMITPAVSVMGAIEGLAVYRPGLAPLVVPMVVGILVGLFFIQSRGTAKVAAFFGPIMLLYFGVIAVLGALSIAEHPQVMAALSPHHAVMLFMADPFRGFLAMGSAVLAVTGAEALYADMGHFGRSPIRVSWLALVLPALVLNYLGQASLLVRNPEALVSPFYYLAPEWFQWPLLGLASAAAVIASQAVITGAFSVTQQAIQLGFIPRMTIKYTSVNAGQIYIPVINWALMIAVILLVLVFERSSNLTAAYGIAVTGAMAIDNVLLAVVLLQLWNWRLWQAVPLLALFFALDAAYLSANFTKIPDGGWVPLVMGLTIFTLLTTWSKGRTLMRQNMAEGTIPFEVFAKSAHSSAARVSGTAVFMSSTAHGVPSALLHNIKHNKVLHERVVVLTVAIQDVPYVDDAERFTVKQFGEGFFKVALRFGFLEETDVPTALSKISMCGERFEMMKTSFFLSRQTLIPSSKPGMALWREKLFAWMLRNAASAMEFFRLPTNRVVELGSQVEISSLARAGREHWAVIRLAALGLVAGLREGRRSAAIAVACGLGFGAFMAAADASVFHAAIPAVQREIAATWPLGARLGRFLIGALQDELLLRGLGLTALVWAMAALHGRPEPRHRAWAIVLTAGVLWPLSAPGYVAGLDWSGLTLAREVVLHGGAGLLWGWLCCRHGWVAGVLGHGCAHLALQPLLVAVTL